MKETSAVSSPAIPNTASAGAADPVSARARVSGSFTCASKSWRTTPNENTRSSSLPRALRTRKPSCRARLRRLPEQPRLADAGRALHDDDAAVAAARVPDERVQGLRLVDAFDQGPVHGARKIWGYRRFGG